MDAPHRQRCLQYCGTESRLLFYQVSKYVPQEWRGGHKADHTSACHGLMRGMIDAWTPVGFFFSPSSELQSFHQCRTAGFRIRISNQPSVFVSPSSPRNLLDQEKQNSAWPWAWNVFTYPVEIRLCSWIWCWRSGAGMFFFGHKNCAIKTPRTEAVSQNGVKTKIHLVPIGLL